MYCPAVCTLTLNAHNIDVLVRQVHLIMCMGPTTVHPHIKNYLDFHASRHGCKLNGISEVERSRYALPWNGPKRQVKLSRRPGSPEDSCVVAEEGTKGRQWDGKLVEPTV